MTRVMHPNSLKNLQPAWKPGEAGNPAGRRTFGAYVREWLNSMADWTEEKLEATASDTAAPVNKRVAAFRLLATLQPEREGLKATEFVVNYTDGKPTQRHEIRQVDRGSVQERIDALRARFAPDDQSDQNRIDPNGTKH